MKPKIIVITGPTASGKSDLAVGLAKKFNGEVVSADSRQVYIGLDIGSGKITKEEMGGIPHHLLDVANPKKRFSVAEYKKLALKAVDNVLSRGKLPIIAGGTGFYIQAIVDNTNFPRVAPNEQLRKELKDKSKEELFLMLKELDSQRAKEVDRDNPQRLIRSIEIAKALGRVSELVSNPIYNALQIGIETDEKLRNRIKDRLEKRLDEEIIEEVENLHKDGMSWDRLDELGLEYRYVSRMLRGLLSREEMIKQLENKIWQYSRRQLSWFRRDKRIFWFKLGEKEEIEAKIEKFLEN